MKHSDFKIGKDFWLGDQKWRCTDTGTRTIAAILVSGYEDDESWLKGPPYAVTETVLDEYDIEDCFKRKPRG